MINKIIGIDASINSTGLVSFSLSGLSSIVDVDYLGFTQVKRNGTGKVIHYKKDDFGNYIDQNIFMRDYVEIFCSGASHIAIEDYAYAAKGKVFHIAEYTGTLKTMLYENGHALRFYDPPTIKMFASGKGNADKIRMTDEFDTNSWNNKPNLTFLIDQNRPKSRYDSPRSDLVDAYFIAMLLHLELCLKNPSISGFSINAVKDKKLLEIFLRKTKGNPIALIDREFLMKGKI